MATTTKIEVNHVTIVMSISASVLDTTVFQRRSLLETYILHQQNGTLKRSCMYFMHKMAVFIESFNNMVNMERPIMEPVRLRSI